MFMCMYMYMHTYLYMYTYHVHAHVHVDVRVHVYIIEQASGAYTLYFLGSILVFSLLTPTSIYVCSVM